MCLLTDMYQVNRATEAPRLGDSCRLLWAIAQGEGGYLAVYRGLTPNVLGNCTSWALYFLFYDQAKRAIGGARSRLELSYADFFLASGTAGMETILQEIFGFRPMTLSQGWSRQRALIRYGL